MKKPMYWMPGERKSLVCRIDPRIWLLVVNLWVIGWVWYSKDPVLLYFTLVVSGVAWLLDAANYSAENRP